MNSLGDLISQWGPRRLYSRSGRNDSIRDGGECANRFVPALAPDTKVIEVFFL